jgi:hypothetical protein
MADTTSSTSTVSVAVSTAGSIVTSMIALANELLPALGLGSNQIVAAILTALEAVIPILVSAVPEMIDEVKAVIDAIKGSEYATPELIAQAETLATSVDAAWEAAKADYLANHPATEQGS